MSDRNDEWGPWTPWDATRAVAPPLEVRPGDLVQADLYIRPDRRGTIERPDFVRGFEFVVQNGECFTLHPMGMMPSDIATTHLVERYRLRGTGFTAKDESLIREAEADPKLVCRSATHRIVAAELIARKCRNELRSG